MSHDLAATIALLERTPAALDALLRDLPESWTHRNEGEGTWTALGVIEHLIQAERTNWMTRARQIRESGDARPFEPFDREASLQAGPSLGELLDTFARSRAESLSELRGWSLGDDDLQRRGLHPAFGGVTLSQLLATWAAHDLSHLHQLSRILAHQYRPLVGPWSAYLGVMQCEGHSS